jgi:hypothetical protein
VTCDTDIARWNSRLLSALAGGFQEVSQDKTHMVSSRSDPVIVKEDWLNDLMECVLTLLARRGESFTLSENSEELRGTSDYLEAVNNMDQEDIRMLMPQSRGLYNFCSSPCVALEIYSDSHLKTQDSDQNLSVTDHESRMARKEDEEVMHFSPSESDKEILQRSEEDPFEATTTSVAKSFKSPSSVTNPGLVMRQLRIMNAKVEELQQDALQTKKAASYREIQVERKFKEQDKQINSLKRKRCNSCSTVSPANSSSAAKQAKKSITSSKKKLPPATSKPCTPAENILTAEAVSDAVKEVQDLEADNSFE